MRFRLALTAVLSVAALSQATSLAQDTPAPAAFDPSLHAAVVGNAPIALEDISHWIVVAQSGSARPRPTGTKHCSALVPTSKGYGASLKQAMTFVVRGMWLDAEAGERGIQTTASEVRRSLARARRQAFPKLSEYREYLRSSCQTEADLLRRQRVQIVERRISRQVIGDARTAQGKQRRLARFFSSYREKWRARTYCAAAYVIGDCVNSKSTK